MNVLDMKVIQKARGFVLYADLESTASKSWLVHQMLGQGESSTFYGAPGCGKGVIIQDMCMHIAAGREWHGRPVTRGAVVYVALERKKLVERRAIAFRKKHGLLDLPFAIVGGVFDFRNPATALYIANICKQVEELTGEAVVLIVIDTLSRALAGGDENSPKDMGAVVNSTAQLQEKTGAHALWVHHMPHDGDRMRGHGALLGAMDTTLHVVKSASGRTATVVKANDSEEGESVAFDLESVEIGEDGTTAPVVIPLNQSQKETIKDGRKWTKGLRLVRDCVDAALIDGGEDHAIAGGPTVRAVTVQAARAIHVTRYISFGEGDREAAERQAWRRNFKAARDSGLIGGEAREGQEWIWLI